MADAGETLVRSSELAAAQAECGRLRGERDALRLRLAEVERERDERSAFANAETAHATKWAQRCDSLREQLATMATERDDARRVAKTLVRYSASEDPPSCAKWRAAADTALAYEVEP